MRSQESETHNPIDVSMKMLIRGRPEAALSLAGLEANTLKYRFEDTSVLTREYRSDQVMILDIPKLAISWEYQLAPKADTLRNWFAKCANLTIQLDMPVLLVAIYLEKGDYATFLDRHETTFGSLTTLFQFNAIKLWEHADRIRSGELIELAPLLILCDNQPRVETVQEEIYLISNSNLPPAKQFELYQTVFRIAGARLPKEVIDVFYQEINAMVKEDFEIDYFLEATKNFVRNQVIAEVTEKVTKKVSAEVTEKVSAEVTEKVSAAVTKKVSAEVSVKNKDEMTRKLLRSRLGQIPQSMEDYLRTASVDQLDSIFDQALRVESYADLRLP